MRVTAFASIGLSFFLTACAVGPNYRRPQASVPPQWTAPATGGTQPGVEPSADHWWKSFNDRELESLITRAAETNYDVKSSVARLEEARAASGIAKSAFYPQIGAAVSAEGIRQAFVHRCFHSRQMTIRAGLTLPGKSMSSGASVARRKRPGQTWTPRNR